MNEMTTELGKAAKILSTAAEAADAVAQSLVTLNKAAELAGLKRDSLLAEIMEIENKVSAAKEGHDAILASNASEARKLIREAQVAADKMIATAKQVADDVEASLVGRRKEIGVMDVEINSRKGELAKLAKAKADALKALA